MNVTSRKISKALYEISGWSNTHFWHNEASAVTEPTMKMWVLSDHEGGYDRSPAYDLGYLLRKLEHLEGLAVVRYHTTNDILSWAVEVDAVDSFEEKEFEIAETPEDAAAQLCIELFKQGVLIKVVV
jgi:hypothetical protein